MRKASLNRREFLCGLGLASLYLGIPRAVAADTSRKPNIIYVLCDDLGYGDVQCLNPERGKIKTPNIDRLAAGGMIFRDAHSGSSVCTPTRYGILTGRYSWRTHLQNGVLDGSSPALISRDRLTVAGLLKNSGYHTACIGKWHLGMRISQEKDAENIIKEGPLTRGFDRFFGICASLDMPPYAFIDGDKFTEMPTAIKTFIRKGAAAPSFEAVDGLPKFTEKATEYIKERSAVKDQPFFLYLPLPSPHTPIVPSKEWEGKSGLGKYADYVMQTDWTLGEVMKAVSDAGVEKNTIIIFTSDNGCSPSAKIEELNEKGHYPSASFRGTKADIFDGGHRIPFIVRWPDRVKAGSSTDQLVCLTDLMATSAEMVGAKLPDNAGEDSVSLLPILEDKAKEPVREAVVHHSINGSFAIRQGKWKLELCQGSGGWSAPKPGSEQEKKLPPVQLYDMQDDIGERKNVYEQNKDVVDKLTKLLEKYVAEGRSTPGAQQKNDVKVDIIKSATNQKDRKGKGRK